jgi:hypothetical protein
MQVRQEISSVSRGLENGQMTAECLFLPLPFDYVRTKFGRKPGGRSFGQ